MVARYGEPLARAWITLENFERMHKDVLRVTGIKEGVFRAPTKNG